MRNPQLFSWFKFLLSNHSCISYKNIYSCTPFNHSPIDRKNKIATISPSLNYFQWARVPPTTREEDWNTGISKRNLVRAQNLPLGEFYLHYDVNQTGIVAGCPSHMMRPLIQAFLLNELAGTRRKAEYWNVSISRQNLSTTVRQYFIIHAHKYVVQIVLSRRSRST